MLLEWRIGAFQNSGPRRACTRCLPWTQAPTRSEPSPGRPHLVGLYMVGYEDRAVDKMLRPRRADPWTIAPSVTSASEPCTLTQSGGSNHAPSITSSRTALCAARNPILECVPSQNGLVIEPPHRHNATVALSARNSLPSASMSKTGPFTRYGPLSSAVIFV